MSNEEINILGELDNRVKANQPGLLSLFSAIGYDAQEVTLVDLYALYKISHNDFIVAIALLFPECNIANASDAWYFQHQDKQELSSDRLDRLGINKGYEYSSDIDNFKSVNEQLVSYKTIAKYLAYVILAAVVAWLIYYVYKRYFK